MARRFLHPSLFPTAADLALVSGANVPSGQIAEVALISSTAAVSGRYRFVVGSTSPDNNQSQLIVVPGTSPGSGKWVRCDPSIDLVIAVTSANTDNQTLVTVPAEITLLTGYQAPFLEITTIWAGGIASTIGLSFSTPSLARTKGNLAGGGAGNSGFTATFFAQMTLGSQFAAGLAQAPVLCPTSLILFDRIVSAFTSGAGNFHLPSHLFATTITPAAPP